MLAKIAKSKWGWIAIVGAILFVWYILPILSKIISILIVVLVVVVLVASLYVRNGIKRKLKG